MNSDEIWLLQLWSGVFGASIGAIAAAGVALLVVTLTNKHQAKLAKEASDLQTALAGKALDEQRAQSKLALAAQEKGLRLQLEEQKAEAIRARYLSATADFITAVEMGYSTFRRGGDFEDIFVQMESARVRMLFDSGSPQLMDELEDWTFLVWNLCRDASAEHELSIDDGAPTQTLNEATAAVTSILIRWHESDTDMQEEMLKALRKEREAAEQKSHAYRELRKTSHPSE